MQTDEMDGVRGRAGRVAAWFGPRLRELRRAAGITQKQLAERCGLFQSRIAEYESTSTRRQPDWETVLRITYGLGLISPETFLREPECEKAANPESEKIQKSD